MSTSGSTEVGRSLAGYRLDAEIGHGGMGVVYRAHDAALDRSVAVKLIAPRLASDRGFRDRFLVEARLAASLDHPNVIPVYDAGEVDGQLYLAMRYVEGTDLRELLAEQGELDVERAMGICGQVAAALDVAHERGLLHRDVKPSNVLLDERGHAYLADFGLTRRLTDAAPEFDAGLSLGTPAYVAPEQIEGKQTGPASDQYSLACLLYECLTGEPPYRRATEAATLYAHLEDDPPYLPHLEHVLARALAKDPAKRFESCAAFIEAARDALPHTRRRRRLLAAAVALAALAAAAITAVLVLTGDDGPTVGHHWTRVPHVESVFGGTQATHPLAVASDGTRLVAAGRDGLALDERSDTAVWTSTDGVTWARVRELSLGGAGWQGAVNVSSTPLGFIIAGVEGGEHGYCGDAGGPDCTTSAAIWRSTDGTDWQQVPNDNDVFGRPDELSYGIDVVAAGPGVIAAGFGTEPGADFTWPIVWTSDDAERWTRTRLPLGTPLNDNYRFALLWAVAAGQAGSPVVAVGVELYYIENPDPDSNENVEFVVSAAWISPDGRSWQRVPHDAFEHDIRGQSLADVAVGRSGIVAVGAETGPPGEELWESVLSSPGPKSMHALIVTSADGQSWSRVPNARLPGRGDGVSLDSITYGESGYVVVGWRRNNPGVADADIDPVVWLSSDGTTWTEATDAKGALSQPGGQIMIDVVSGGPGLVAVGLDGDTKGFNTAMWTSP